MRSSIVGVIRVGIIKVTDDITDITEQGIHEKRPKIRKLSLDYTGRHWLRMVIHGLLRRTGTIVQKTTI